MVYDEYLAHHGVKGQKWGQRNWQNEDGTYTDAGKRHYGWGNGRQFGGIKRLRIGAKGGAVQRPRQPMGTRYATGNRQPQKAVSQRQQEQIRAARRAKAKKVLAIGAGVAVAAALGYAAYKGSTNLRNDYRNQYQIDLQRKGVRQDAAEKAAKKKFTRRSAFKQFRADRSETLKDIGIAKTNATSKAFDTAARNGGKLPKAALNEWKNTQRALKRWEWNAYFGRGVTKNRAVVMR